MGKFTSSKYNCIIRSFELLDDLKNPINQLTSAVKLNLKNPLENSEIQIDKSRGFGYTLYLRGKTDLNGYGDLEIQAQACTVTSFLKNNSASDLVL